MRKTRIFIKIYLWFWLATALVVATQISLDHLTESGPPFEHIRHELGKPLAFFGQMALDHYLRGEISSLSHLAHLFKESTGIDAYLLDQGRDVGNRQLQDDSAQLAARAAQSGTMQTSFLHDTIVVALPVSAGETEGFVVVGEIGVSPATAALYAPSARWGADFHRAYGRRSGLLRPCPLSDLTGHRTAAGHMPFRRRGPECACRPRYRQEKG